MASALHNGLPDDSRGKRSSMENLIFPAVMGRRLEINPFVVFLAILFWTWVLIRFIAQE